MAKPTRCCARAFAMGLSFARLSGSRSHGKVLISGLVKTGSLREAVALVDEVRSFIFLGGVGKSRSTVLSVFSVMLCQISLLQYCVEIFFCPEMLEAAHKIGDETCSWSGCGTSHYFLIYPCTWLGAFILERGLRTPAPKKKVLQLVDWLQTGRCSPVPVELIQSTWACGLWIAMNGTNVLRDIFDFGNAEDGRSSESSE